MRQEDKERVARLRYFIDAVDGKRRLRQDGQDVTESVRARFREDLARLESPVGAAMYAAELAGHG
jgi:hypothetical protein